MEELQSCKGYEFRVIHAIVPIFANYHIWTFHYLARQSTIDGYSSYNTNLIKGFKKYCKISFQKSCTYLHDSQ